MKTDLDIQRAYLDRLGHDALDALTDILMALNDNPAYLTTSVEARQRLKDAAPMLRYLRFQGPEGEPWNPDYFSLPPGTPPFPHDKKRPLY